MEFIMFFLNPVKYVYNAFIRLFRREPDYISPQLEFNFEAIDWEDDDMIEEASEF